MFNWTEVVIRFDSTVDSVEGGEVVMVSHVSDVLHGSRHVP